METWDSTKIRGVKNLPAFARERVFYLVVRQQLPSSSLSVSLRLLAHITILF